MKNKPWQGSLIRGALCVALLAQLLRPGFAAESVSPEEWLQRMGDSLEYLNYTGTLVYMRPGQADTFRVFHRVENREVTERLISMDGGGAEIIRKPNELVCIFPEQRSVVVGIRDATSVKPGPLRARLPTHSAALARNYSVSAQRNDRVLGRDVVVIAIEPLDEFRYGYHLWLDTKTAMPLKSQLLDNDVRMPIEEILFTSIEFPELVPNQAIASDLDTSSYTWVRQSATPDLQKGLAQVQRWSAGTLPDGFMLGLETVEFSANSNEPRLHQVYSDGLASVSVFIEMAVAASEQVEGLSMVGAANAYSVIRDGLQVTAMGAVPARTVELIAYGMRPQDSSE